jgi:conjugal transfer pilus assembly protein TraU
MNRWRWGVCWLWLSCTFDAQSVACQSAFINPLTDICWNCILPITLGSVPLTPSRYPDTPNPTLPLSFCGRPPLLVLPSLNIGYWSPSTLVDVTRVPWCMVSMGLHLPGPQQQQIGGGWRTPADGQSGGFYHAHWYKYPLLYWLQLLTSVACHSSVAFDLAYMTELDPLWDDDQLAMALNPEALLFGQPAAQLACAAEATKTATNQALPMDNLFWCLGSQGSVYPLTGHLGYRDTPLQAATLIMERLNYKMHRQGLVLESSGKAGAICRDHVALMLPKSRYRYQLSRMLPEASRCHPYTTTTSLWEQGHASPQRGDDYGFVQFQKRNCAY